MAAKCRCRPEIAVDERRWRSPISSVFGNYRLRNTVKLINRLLAVTTLTTENYYITVIHLVSVINAIYGNIHALVVFEMFCPTRTMILPMTQMLWDQFICKFKRIKLTLIYILHEVSCNVMGQFKAVSEYLDKDTIGHEPRTLSV